MDFPNSFEVAHNVMSDLIQSFETYLILKRCEQFVPIYAINEVLEGFLKATAIQ